MIDPPPPPPVAAPPHLHEPETERTAPSDHYAPDETARRQFEAAWSQGQPPPIRNFLPAEDRHDFLATLEELVHIDLEFTWKSPSGQPRLLEEYLAEFPRLQRPTILVRLIEQERRVRSRVGTTPSLDEYRHRFPTVDLSSLSTEPTAARSGGPLGHKPALPELPGFDVLEVLGRGGMGVVYKARQYGLNRLVAIKMILAGAHAASEERRRFRSEAEAVARFQHPNIVQVHEIGEHDDCPYLVLEYVAGGTLAQQLAGTPQSPAEAVRLVATLARAVANVHQRGIVHRDLKPANVLLGDVPKISDFGLAKGLVGQDQGTLSGTPLGTPSYMAPEQAAGRVRDMGPAVDIYALGAILYEILTGRPPFKAASAQATLALVLQEEPVPPRALQPSVPRDLEVICLTCLHKETRRRYGSAALLADDLERFERGESIRARPARRLERVWRWCRRHPREAGLLATLAVVIVASFAALTQLYLIAETRRQQAEQNEAMAKTHADRADRERQKAEDNGNQASQNAILADRERQKAEKNLHAAKAVVDFFFVQVSTNDLLGKAGLQPLRKTLLRSAVKYYRTWLQDYRDDPALASTLARTWFRVGMVETEIGTKADALAAFRQALQLYQKLSQTDPKGLAYERELLYTMGNLAILEGQGGPSPETLRTGKGLHELFARRAARAPNNASYQADLARSWHNTGGAQAALGQLREAAISYREALQLRRWLAARTKHPDHRAAVALTLHNLAKLHNGLGQLQAAETACAEALAIWQELVRHNAEKLEWQHGLADAWQRLGQEQLALGRTAAARKSLDQARTLIDPLVESNREVVPFRASQGHVYHSLGWWHQQHGAAKQAVPLYEKAKAIRTQLVQGQANELTHQAELAATLQRLAEVFQDEGQRTEAEAVQQQARAGAEKIVQQHPYNVDFRHLLSETHYALAKILRNRDQQKEALAELLQAAQHGRVAWDTAPQVPAFRHVLALVLKELGEVSRRLGHLDQAITVARERKQRAGGEPVELFEAACDLAQCAALVQGALAESYRLEAVVALRAAIQGGFRDGARLQSEERLAGLRRRDDFKQLVQELKLEMP